LERNKKMAQARILIVDDDPNIVRFIQVNLKNSGHDVFIAANGAEAVRLVKEEKLDLVLLDVRMPVMDGFEACRRIREQSTVPIIMVSADRDVNDKVKCLELGADYYMTKPFSIDELLARVAATLRRPRGN